MRERRRSAIVLKGKGNRGIEKAKGVMTRIDDVSP
jgi:hypothetical protein